MTGVQTCALPICTSLLAMDLFAQIEMKFGRRIPLAILIEASTIEKLAKIIVEDQGSAFWSPLVTIQPEGSKPPFFCIHSAGGNVLIYRDLARHLGPDQPVYGLQAQGMNGVDAFHTSVEDMAAHYLKEIQAIQSDGQYLLGGYCMGGSIALEMAQQLSSQGKKVALVVLMETYNFSECKPQSFVENLQ